MFLLRASSILFILFVSILKMGCSTSEPPLSSNVETPEAVPTHPEEVSESPEITLTLTQAALTSLGGPPGIRVSATLQSSPSTIAVTTLFSNAFNMLSLQVEGENGTMVELHQTHLSPFSPHSVRVNTEGSTERILFILPDGVHIRPGQEVHLVGRLDSVDSGSFELRSNALPAEG